MTIQFGLLTMPTLSVGSIIAAQAPITGVTEPTQWRFFASDGKTGKFNSELAAKLREEE